MPVFKSQNLLKVFRSQNLLSVQITESFEIVQIAESFESVKMTEFCRCLNHRIGGRKKYMLVEERAADGQKKKKNANAK